MRRRTQKGYSDVPFSTNTRRMSIHNPPNEYNMSEASSVTSETAAEPGSGTKTSADGNPNNTNQNGTSVGSGEPNNNRNNTNQNGASVSSGEPNNNRNNTNQNGASVSSGEPNNNRNNTNQNGASVSSGEPNNNR